MGLRVQIRKSGVHSSNIHDRFLIESAGVVQVAVRSLKSLEVGFVCRVPGAAYAHGSDAKPPAPAHELLLGRRKTARRFSFAYSPVVRVRHDRRPFAIEPRRPSCRVFGQGPHLRQCADAR
ncbi:MAG TPA: hypothetical protein VL349_07570 [Terriglobales bacterium]|nr:hypothetical protein [Terriglobales bacterium]